MIRTVLVAIALLAFGAADAQMIPLTGAGGSGVTGTPPPPGYTGPGNVVSGAGAFYSCTRGYSAAYATGSNAGCTFRRASDNHTCDILITSAGDAGNTANCSTGGDNAQSAAAFCNATSCFVTKAYDQTGNGLDMVQATAGSQPAVAFACIGGKLCLQPNNQFMAVAGTPAACTGYLPSTMITAAEATGSPASPQVIMAFCGDSGNDDSMFFGIAADTWSIFANGEQDATALDNKWHSAIAVISATSSSTLTIDGSANAGTVGGIAQDGSLYLFATSGAGAPITGGNWTESGWWPTTAFSSGQQTSMCQNQQAYYGAGDFGAAC